MNYLAHLYLSGNDPHVRIGNFIGDYVKGNSYDKYSPGIRKGILLHRRIDDFTDKHPIVKQSAAKLYDHYGRYSGIITDMFYDHLLAAGWDNYSKTDLSTFVTDVHKLLIFNYFKLPARVKGFLPFLIKNRGLENYQYISGLRRALTIMSNRSSLPSKTDTAIKILEEHYDEFRTEFNTFFPEVIGMSQQFLRENS
jgi:acyl carrier protein phosphodiesterase